MDQRAKIPAIALLGLSCTECTERTANNSDPIVGDWLAVDIDGEKFPMSEGPEGRSAWLMEVEPDHGGRFVYYGEYEYDGLTMRYEYYSAFTVDVADAPRYRITVEADLATGLIGGDSVVIGEGGDTGDAATGYDSDSDGYMSSGALEDDDDAEAEAFDENEFELAGAPRPARAAAMVLDCELAAGRLACTRQVAAGAEAELVHWTFERQPGDD